LSPPLGTETKTHTEVDQLRWMQHVFDCGVLICVPKKVLTDVACMKTCLKLGCFGVSSHMVLAVVDSLMYPTCWLAMICSGLRCLIISWSKGSWLASKRIWFTAAWSWLQSSCSWLLGCKWVFCRVQTLSTDCQMRVTTLLK